MIKLFFFLPGDEKQGHTKHATNSQNPGDVNSVYRLFSWQARRKTGFALTLLVQEWTSGFYPRSLPLIQEFQQLLIGVFFMVWWQHPNDKA